MASLGLWDKPARSDVPGDGGCSHTAFCSLASAAFTKWLLVFKNWWLRLDTFSIWKPGGKILLLPYPNSLAPLLSDVYYFSFNEMETCLSRVRGRIVFSFQCVFFGPLRVAATTVRQLKYLESIKSSSCVDWLVAAVRPWRFTAVKCFTRQKTRISVVTSSP